MMQGFVDLLQMSEFDQPVNKKMGKFKMVVRFYAVHCADNINQYYYS